MGLILTNKGGVRVATKASEMAETVMDWTGEDPTINKKGRSLCNAWGVTAEVRTMMTAAMMTKMMMMVLSAYI